MSQKGNISQQIPILRKTKPRREKDKSNRDADERKKEAETERKVLQKISPENRERARALTKNGQQSGARSKRTELEQQSELRKPTFKKELNPRSDTIDKSEVYVIMNKTDVPKNSRKKEKHHSEKAKIDGSNITDSTDKNKSRQNLKTVKKAKSIKDIRKTKEEENKKTQLVPPTPKPKEKSKLSETPKKQHRTAMKSATESVTSSIGKLSQGSSKRIAPKKQHRTAMKSVPEPVTSSIRKQSQGSSKRIESSKIRHHSIESNAKSVNTVVGKKEFIINKQSKGCYVCRNRGHYFNGSFFCGSCKTKFANIVCSCSTVVCIKYGKCISPEQCGFCLAEIFFSHGIRATDVSDFNYASYANKSGSDKNNTLNKEEQEFCKYFNKCINYVLDWIWQQGDLLKLTPNDRKVLLHANLGRARVMWIVIETIPRHNVIKTDDGHLAISNFSSEIIRKTVIDISDLASYFRGIPSSSQQVYFMKLLSIFQLGVQDINLERKKEVVLIANKYRNIMSAMFDNTQYMKEAAEMIDTMYLINSCMSTVKGIEDARKCLTKWTITNPDWERREKDVTSFTINSYPKERIELCVFLNSISSRVLKCAYNYLTNYLSRRDQKTVLLQNIMSLLVIYICWNTESVLDSKVEKPDRIVKLFYSHLSEIRKHLKDLINYINLNDLILLCSLNDTTGMNIELEDGDLIQLFEYSKKLIRNNMNREMKEKGWKENKRSTECRRLEDLLDAILKKIEKAASMLELSYSVLPLFENIKAWITETL